MQVVQETPKLHPHAHPDGGQACPDDDLLKRQRDALGEWLKNMGQRLFSGNLNILNTPFPVKMFEPRSYLEKLADPWGVEHHLLIEAARTSDAARRMALVMAHFVAGIHVAFEKWMKPFNPILGETWQAQLPDGTRLDLEQISHHPPVSAFFLEGAGFKLVGQSWPSIQLSLRDQGFRSITARGYRYIEFDDGAKVDIHNPEFVFKNLVGTGKPRVEVIGTAFFTDTHSGLCGVIHFGEATEKGATNQPGIKHRSDTLAGGIYEVAGATMADPSWIGQQQEFRRQGHRPLSSSSNGSKGAAEVFKSEYSGCQGVLHDQEAPEVKASVGIAHGEGSEHAVADGNAQQQEGQHLCSSGGGGGNTTGGSIFSGFNKLVGGLKSGPNSGGAIRSMGAALGKLHIGPSWGGGKNGGQSPGELPPGLKEYGKQVLSVEGNWLSHMDVGGERVWTWASQRRAHFLPVDDPLPSDCRFRQDLVALRAGDLAEAGRWKQCLEQRQRNDKALREAGKGCGAKA